MRHLYSIYVNRESPASQSVHAKSRSDVHTRNATINKLYILTIIVDVHLPLHSRIVQDSQSVLLFCLRAFEQALRVHIYST